MKVLHVTTHLNIGGIGNYILSLCGALKDRGMDCIVASSGGNLEEEFDKRGIGLKKLDIRTKFEFGPKVFKSSFTLARIIKNEKIDIVHAHTRVSQVAAVLACHMAHTPCVTTCHGYFKKRSRNLIDTWGAKVIAISDAVKAHLIEDLGVDEKRIVVVYSGVDIKRFSKIYSEPEKRAIKESIGLKSGPVVGTIGRLSSVKGQKFLIEAMAEVAGEVKDAQALIIGDGEEKLALESLAKSLGIEDSVRFVNSNVDTNRFLSVMDIFVFPSVKEGLGIALLEALAAGRACVASDIGGIADIIANDNCGVLVPVGDAAAISSAILKLLRSAEERRRMGEIGKKVVAEKFSIGRMAEEIERIYEKTVKIN